MNKKVIRTCPYCPRKFSGEGPLGITVGRVNANITNHIKGAHPEHYAPSASALARQQAKKEAAINQEGLDRMKRDFSNLPKIKPQVLISGPYDKSAENPAKRPYVRKQQPQSSVCYCPKCGCNIRAVQVAMGI